MIDVSATPEQRASWFGKLVLILAAAGSAVDLGTIWRFPYLAAHYNGGTFIIVFLGLMPTLGVTLLVLEATLGRYTQDSVIKAFASFGRCWRPVGVFITIIPLVISAYYCMVGGWVTHYVFAYGAGQSARLANGGVSFSTFIVDFPQLVALMLTFVVVTFITVAFGVNGGVERANLIMTPALIVISFLITIYVLARPGALVGLQYLFVPDQPKFSTELLIATLRQTFFGLSVATAAMVTYGPCMKENVLVILSSLQTTLIILGISLLAGLVVIPATFVALGSVNAITKNSGPSLMFLVLLRVFVKLDVAGSVLGPVFFLLVVFVALTSMIPLVESDVTILQDTLGWTRRRSLLIVATLIILAGSVAISGYSSLSFIQPLGKSATLLDFLDFLTSSVMMPLTALVTYLLIGWIWHLDVLVDKVHEFSHFHLRRTWVAMLQYIAPVLIVLVLVTSLLKAFDVVSF